MATLTATFRTESERIHGEHQLLEQVLRKLDSALERLVCYSEVYANLATAEQVRRYGRQLIEEFPGHCRREQALVLGPVSKVSPELAEFCDQMKVEHSELLVRLSMFRAALDDFDKAEDLNEAICDLKDTGKELTQQLRHHVVREEQELSGFF